MCYQMKTEKIMSGIMLNSKKMKTESLSYYQQGKLQIL